MRILVVEDDVKIASFVSKGLKAAGYAVDHVKDGSEGLALLESEAYDAAVVDIMLPGMDGLSLVRQLRKGGRNTPVLILSARGSIEDRVRGLQVGADDYLPKPFAFSELLARIHALIRRSTGAAEPTRLTAGGLQIDLLSREVSRDGRSIDLQPLEFSLLEYLMRNQGRVVSRSMIMEHVWNYNFDPQTNVVESRICRLRDKIDKSFEPKMIQTVRGVGYVLRKDA